VLPHRPNLAVCGLVLESSVILQCLKARWNASHHANPETGYTIARIDPGRGPDLVTAVGPLLGAQVGESLRMRGRWTSHPQYGKQFEVFSYRLQDHSAYRA
jgi:hypothetical protein